MHDKIKVKLFFLLQVIAHHPMQSISFASGGDTVSAAFFPPSMLLPDILADCTLDDPVTEESIRMLI